MKDEILNEMVKAQSVSDDILKSFVQPGSATTGLQAYNLEAPSKKMYPVLTPLRNSIARVSGGFATQANWKVISGINVGNTRAGISEGKRGGIITHSQADYFASFRAFGLENNVTFEAQYASKNFEDAKALAVQQTLEATMIQEEKLMLGGNTSVNLGTTPTPTVVAATSGGALPAATYSVICIALGLQAYLDLVGANNGAIGQSFVDASSIVAGQITRTNADGTTDSFGDGSARKSTAATGTVASGSAGTLTCSVAAVNGAVGYAWYVGAAGSERLNSVSSVNSVVITAASNGAAQLASSIAASDNSTSTLDFDGLLYQAFKPNSGAFVYTMPNGTAGVGTGLTADGAGGIAEFEMAFVYFYNKYRLSPTVIYLSSQELINITKKIVGNNGAPLLNLNTNVDSPASIQAGVVVGSYLNKVTGTRIPLRVHPNMPAGTIFFYSESLPYQLSGIQNTVQMLMRQDYYQIEWPLKSRKYEYGVYADGVLQNYAPFSMGIITNIANT